MTQPEIGWRGYSLFPSFPSCRCRNTETCNAISILNDLVSSLLLFIIGAFISFCIWWERALNVWEPSERLATLCCVIPLFDIFYRPEIAFRNDQLGYFTSYVLELDLSQGWVWKIERKIKCRDSLGRQELSRPSYSSSRFFGLPFPAWKFSVRSHSAFAAIQTYEVLEKMK